MLKEIQTPFLLFYKFYNLTEYIFKIKTLITIKILSNNISIYSFLQTLLNEKIIFT